MPPRVSPVHAGTSEGAFSRCSAHALSGRAPVDEHESMRDFEHCPHVFRLLELWPGHDDTWLVVCDRCALYLPVDVRDIIG